MKTLGLIGGMSWESSIEYYRIINETVRDRLGGLHSARSLMYSVDFAEIEALQHAGRWEEATRMMVDAAGRLEAGGADGVIICTNTMHRMAAAVQERLSVPLLHIADATARRIQAAGLQHIGLLGTRFTMEDDFYCGRLVANHGLDVVIPEQADRETVHRVIYEELVVGEIRPESKARYLEIVAQLVARGAQGVILGCTEIGLLVKQADTRVPLFDTTRIHAEAAVDWALATDPG